MPNATLAWRTKHAGVKLTDINKTVAKMVSVAKKVKDLNGDGEVQASELKKVAAKSGPKLAKLMETIRYGSGFWARDAQPGGNPYFSHNEFIDDYAWQKGFFKAMDKDGDGKLNAAELKGASSKMKQAIVEFVTGK